MVFIRTDVEVNLRMQSRSAANDYGASDVLHVGGEGVILVDVGGSTVASRTRRPPSCGQAAIEASLAAADQKLAAMRQQRTRHAAIHLGMPDFGPSAGQPTAHA
jgi:hypothetical protein